MCAVLCGICNKYKPVRVRNFWILGVNHVNGSVKELCLRVFLTDFNNASKQSTAMVQKPVGFTQQERQLLAKCTGLPGKKA